MRLLIFTLIIVLTFLNSDIEAQDCRDTLKMNQIVDSILFQSEIMTIDAERALYLKNAELLYTNCEQFFSPTIGRANYLLCDYYYSTLGDFKTADSLIDRNLEFLIRAPKVDTLILYACQSLKAATLIGLEEPNLALDILNELKLKTRDDSNFRMKRLRVGVLNRIGMANRRIRNFEEALRAYEDMRELAKTAFPLGNSIFRQIKGNVAGVYSANGEFEKAISIYKDILAELDTIPDVSPMEKARIMYNLGFQYDRTFQYSLAIENYTRSINTRILGNVHQTRHQAIAFQSRASCHGSIHLYSKAQSDLEEASKILFTISDENEISRIRLILSNLQLRQEMGDTTGTTMLLYIKAKTLLNNMLTVTDEDSAYLVSGLCNQFGVISSTYGEASDSKFYYKQALRLQEAYSAIVVKDIANTCGNIAGSCFLTKEYEEGYQYANRSLELAMPSSSIDYYLHTGTGTPLFLYVLRFSARLAMGMYDQQQDQNRGTLLAEWERMLFGLEVLEAYCQYSADYSKSLLNFLSDELLPIAAEMAWRLATEEEDKQYYYGRIIEFSERNKHYFGYLETQNIAYANDVFSPREKQLRQATKAQYLRWQELENSSPDDKIAIARASEYYLSLKDSLNYYQQTKNTGNNLSSTLGNEFSIFNFQSLASLNGETLLGYLATEDNIFITLVKPSGYTVKRISKQAELFSSIKQLEESLFNDTNDGPADKVESYSEAAYNLYQYLLKPVIEELPNRFVVSYDPALGGLLPFDILLTEPVLPTQKLSLDQFPYVIKKYTISYTLNTVLHYRIYPSIEINTLTEHSLVMAPLGSIDFNDIRSNGLGFYTAIPESSMECKTVSSLLQTQPIQDEQATEIYFLEKAPKAPIIHLATHGVYNPRQPNLSGILFASNTDSIENEVLYLPEVYDLSLQARLVSLSACETNIGQLVKGEGVLSISRAFLVAGAHSVVATQWPIRPHNSGMIITLFYKKLNVLDKAEALRQAKLDYLKKVDGFEGHPYYWAGSVLTGHTGKL